MTQVTALNIDELLGRAYRAMSVGGNRPEAIKLIQDATADPAVALVLRQKRDYLTAVRDARRMGQQDGCHVTATLVELLTRALP